MSDKYEDWDSSMPLDEWEDMHLDDDDDKIECPYCHSDKWECWDERTLDCWNDKGWMVGVEVVGYLRCKACGQAYTHTAVERPEEACDCD